MFHRITPTTPDALYTAAASCAADPRTDKMDLTVGVYRDVDGQSPVMEVVKAAEGFLLRDQTTKAYRPLLGDPGFLRSMTELALGARHPLIAEGRVVAIQATGGTGALRLAAALAKSAYPETRLHLGTPSWPSHAGVFGGEGVPVIDHPYWHNGAQSVNWNGIINAARSASAGDLFLMHGPCHNPTGIDLDRDQRAKIMEALQLNGAIPILDVAYYGLGDGLAADLQIVRDAVGSGPRSIVAMSCSKAFGLYRERTGILLVICADASEAARVGARLGSLSRLLVSSAPAHGAEAVARILCDPALDEAWRIELEGMRQRILGLRARLADSGVPVFAHIAGQKGIFAMLPLTPENVATLGRDHAIYMPPSGRANLVGLREGDVDRFVQAIAQVCTTEMEAA